MTDTHNRLSVNIRPLSYNIFIRPNIFNSTFYGKVEIVINISDNTNIRVMELLRKHIDSIPKVENNIYWLWPCLFVNPNIFEIDVLSYNNAFNNMVCKIDIA